MPGIYYSSNKDGAEIGRWSGKSKRIDGKVSKDKQIYLGKVIDKENLIFYARNEGIFHFNLETLEKESLPDEKAPAGIPLMDKRLKSRNVIVEFGGSYFLHELIMGIEYNHVLETISLKVPDTMYGLLHYYILVNKADYQAFTWYQNSFARFLYPRANLHSQRISEFYVSFGSDNNRRKFFTKHIEYLKATTDDDYAILIDSTGCQNACQVPVTKVSKHNNEVNVEFRVVLVVQRSTGLPVYYETIPGNVVDSSTLRRIMKIMECYKFKITHVSGDAGYSCPSNIEKLILCGSELIMRLNPTYDMFKKVMEEHASELVFSGYDPLHDIRYRNRIVRVIKIPMVIAKDEKDNDINGFVYLCRDMQAYHSKSDHYMTHHGDDVDSVEKILKDCEKYGVFAIVTSEDLDIHDVIATYYLRQAIEQFFDYAKNYGKMMPVRNHTLKTINGHMLMSFIVTFLAVAIKNKMNIIDSPYVCIPSNLAGEETRLTVETNGKVEVIEEQETSMIVYQSNPSALFYALSLVSADVFEKQKDSNNQIVPGIPFKDANEFFKAFGLYCPESILIGEDYCLEPVFKQGVKNHCKKKMIFSTRPFATQEKIQKELELKKQKEEEKQKKKEAAQANDSTEHRPQEPKKKRRKNESKNKKVLEQEAAIAETLQEVTTVKRGRGRPLGAKDTKPRKRRKKLPSNNSKKIQAEAQANQIGYPPEIKGL